MAVQESVKMDKMSLGVRNVIKNGGIRIINHVVGTQEVGLLQRRIEASFAKDAAVEFILAESAQECLEAAQANQEPGTVSLFWTLVPYGGDKDLLLGISIEEGSGFMTFDVVVGPHEGIPETNGHSSDLAAVLGAFRHHDLMHLLVRCNEHGMDQLRELAAAQEEGQ